MNFKNEKQIILVIRYTLPIFIIFLSIIVTTFLYYENKTSFEKVKITTEEKFIADKKLVIKEQIENIYEYIISEQQETEEALKQNLTDHIYEAHAIVKNIYLQLKDEKKIKEIIPIIRASIKDIRFNNGRGYFFINDMKEGRNIIHSVFPQLEGKILLHHKNSKGNYVTQESIKLLQNNKEAYQEWYWKKSLQDSREYRKIGFVKHIPELNWFIGTGEYVDDFTKDIQKKVLNQIKKFRFGKDGYIFVFDHNDLYLNHMIEDYIGKNAFDINNIQNVKEVTQELKYTVKKGGGYINYMQIKKPSTKQVSEKIIYVKHIPKWNWIIGTGFYKDDVDALINQQRSILNNRYTQNLKNIFIIASLITFALIVISFYISYVIERKFKRYKQSIEQYIEENNHQHELLAQKSKLVAMGEMLENISHQWRQPLSVITIAASGLKINKELNSLSDELLEESLESINSSAHHLSETINDFRDFFRSDKEKTSFSIAQCFQKSLKLISSQLKNRDIEIINSTQEITYNGYERNLLQVLMNILTNAKDALEVKEGKRYLFVDAYTNQNQLYINIKDNAGGIDEKIIDRIFEPYFTTKHKSIGTGIGLYMSEEIISRHMNGTINVKNEEFIYEKEKYKGALFTITLPFDE